ncbi:MAG: glycosyltransferase family 9 protein [Cyanobacteriota bacterium]
MYNKYQDIRKILFIRFGNIGDVVHTTAAYQMIRQNFKNIDIDYLTSSLLQELLNNDIYLHQVISLDDPTLDGIFRLALKLSEENYDLIVNFQPTFKTLLFSAVINKKFTLTYSEFKPSRNQDHIHVVKNFYNTIQPVIPEIELPKDLKLYLNKEIEKWSKHTMEKENITHAIGIIPGAGRKSKHKLWPKEHWKQLLNYICNKRGLNVIILGGTNETKLATELQLVNKNKIRNFCGKLSIAQTTGILSLCMLVIGGDTGSSHIATAVGPKVIGLYGPTNINKRGLFGRGHEIIQSNHNCLACERKNCPYIKENKLYSPCMEKISVDSVIKALGI